MTGSRRRFSVSPPDWGEAHLAADAVVAYVDEELAPGARKRAAHHLEHCAGCAAEVAAQTQARAALRSAGGPSLPASLMSSLRAIPQDVDIPGPPAGLAVGPQGNLVTMLPGARGHGATTGDSTAGHDKQVSRVRRTRVGAVVAVTGLAIGALALSVPLLQDAVQNPERGVFGGSILGSSAGGAAEARLTVPAAGAARGVLDPGLWRRLNATPTLFGFPLRP